MADNDYALGRLVEAVSHSAYWKNTAILVVEDDAQDGPDHVDAHRSLRISVGWNTTDDDIAALTTSLPQVVGRLRQLAR